MFRNRTTIPSALQESELANRVPKRELQLVRQLGTQIVIEDQTEVIRQNSQGREWLFVVDGCLEVQKGDLSVCELGSGDFAGELSLLSSQPRNASVVTTGQTNLYALNRREFASLMDQAPELSKHILTTAVDRLNTSLPS